ncbi:MAG: RDD family protein, partial [Exiguobacterium sp.]|nr:RDD family protein [Exiguobacterium sp.]
MIAVAVPLWKRAVAGQIDQLVFQTPAKLIEKAVRQKIWPDKEVKRYYLPTVVTMAGEVYCMLYQKGQTLGDRVVGIRVVSADGRPLSLEQVVKR